MRNLHLREDMAARPAGAIRDLPAEGIRPPWAPPPLPFPCYSARKAIMGSTRTARHAGMEQARSAMAAKKIPTPP
jgi:hypothetical protein